MALVRLRCKCGTRILIRTTRAMAAGWPVRSFRCHRCTHTTLSSNHLPDVDPETSRLEREPVTGDLAKAL